MPEGTNVIRYETPEVFECLTKEWAIPKPPRRRIRKSATASAATSPASEPPAAE